MKIKHINPTINHIRYPNLYRHEITGNIALFLNDEQAVHLINDSYGPYVFTPMELGAWIKYNGVVTLEND